MIIEQLQIISFAIAIAFAAVVAQVVVLSRKLRSWAWWAIAAAFVILGIRQVWAFVSLPTAIMKARERGIAIPDHLTVEQKISIATIFVVIGLLIFGFDRLRRDLRHIGVN